ncbi:hypothetical protein Y1Q_0005486 [Alligator mississippiensis]|uniref:Uncharacterized protein n=1 Tax=Alligator mississippiensis TaxID=8496 RepID=A0A151MER5_ALLMI|nr:hypothetical protein Y1Q_0005486 [Alligator mississippiensis]
MSRQMALRALGLVKLSLHKYRTCLAPVAKLQSWCLPSSPLHLMALQEWIQRDAEAHTLTFGSRCGSNSQELFFKSPKKQGRQSTEAAVK